MSSEEEDDDLAFARRLAQVQKKEPAGVPRLPTQHMQRKARQVRHDDGDDDGDDDEPGWKTPKTAGGGTGGKNGRAGGDMWYAEAGGSALLPRQAQGGWADGIPADVFFGVADYLRGFELAYASGVCVEWYTLLNCDRRETALSRTALGDETFDWDRPRGNASEHRYRSALVFKNEQRVGEEIASSFGEETHDDQRRRYLRLRFGVRVRGLWREACERAGFVRISEKAEPARLRAGEENPDNNNDNNNHGGAAEDNLSGYQQVAAHLSQLGWLRASRTCFEVKGNGRPCQALFPKFTQLLEHMQVAHQVTAEVRRCDLGQNCKWMFADYHLWRLHRNHRHGPFSYTDACARCHRRFATIEDLREHIHEFHVAIAVQPDDAFEEKVTLIANRVVCPHPGAPPDYRQVYLRSVQATAMDLRAFLRAPPSRDWIDPDSNNSHEFTDEDEQSIWEEVWDDKMYTGIALEFGFLHISPQAYEFEKRGPAAGSWEQVLPFVRDLEVKALSGSVALWSRFYGGCFGVLSESTSALVKEELRLQPCNTAETWEYRRSTAPLKVTQNERRFDSMVMRRFSSSTGLLLLAIFVRHRDDSAVAACWEEPRYHRASQSRKGMTAKEIRPVGSDFDVAVVTNAFQFQRSLQKFVSRQAEESG